MSLLKEPPILKMAPPGFHVVKRCAKVSKDGIKFFVKAHIRKNRGQKIVLLPENILYLYWSGDHDFPALGTVKGFSEYSELDSVIQFWVDYWKEVGLKFPKDFDPFIVKVIIAIESSFKLNANPNSKKSSAFGLMQVTDKTRSDVKNFNDNVLDLERSDLKDPVVSIAMGIRWLSYKYSTIPKNNDKNLFNTLRGYYDWQKGIPYAKKVLDLHDKSCRN